MYKYNIHNFYNDDLGKHFVMQLRNYWPLLFSKVLWKNSCQKQYWAVTKLNFAVLFFFKDYLNTNVFGTSYISLLNRDREPRVMEDFLHNVLEKEEKYEVMWRQVIGTLNMSR